MKRLAVIGAGASGCFCAVNVAGCSGDVSVTVFEAGPVPMAKLALTGGGRCNITNTFEGVDALSSVYPRGFNLMKRLLRNFGPEDTMRWFSDAGVPTVAMDEGRVFPVSEDAADVVNALKAGMERAGVSLRLGKRLSKIEHTGGGYTLYFTDGTVAEADFVLVASGGGTASLISGMGLETTSPVPSLFSFRIADDGLRSLMGSSVEKVILSLAGTRFRSEGPLLMTDWGVSGPSVLRLSSYAARYLAEASYRAVLNVNWTAMTEEEAREWVNAAVNISAGRLVANVHPEGLSARIWKHILSRAGVSSDRRWSELGTKSVNRLVSAIVSDSYDIVGRCRFKDEFVTCGGVALSEVDSQSLESKKHPGLFFSGEVLDIDAVTGGFNLQAAWSTGYSVSRKILLYL